MLPLSDDDEKIAWEMYYEKPLKTKFAWDKENFSKADTVGGVHRSIYKSM